MDSTTTTEQFQRVFFWRWRAPEGQTTFTLHIPELERVYQEAQAELAEELDRDDDLQPAPQQVLPYPGLQQIGGNYGRSQPQQALLVACAPPVPSRLDIDTGWGDASVEELAKRLGFVAKHTGRPKGLSPDDYAAQREWTIARSLSWEFFLNCQELPSAPVIWRDRFGDSATVLGFLLWARRLGRHGVTLSGPQWATILGVGIATVWRYLRTLERAGMLIRMHRWKPGRGARPTALTGNWYGFGPVALETLKELEAPKDAVKKARLRLRRRHLRAKQRREGRQLLRGYAYPPQEEWLAQTLAATDRGLRRDDQRWADFQAGLPPTDYTSTVVPSFVVTWEYSYSGEFAAGDTVHVAVADDELPTTELVVEGREDRLEASKGEPLGGPKHPTKEDGNLTPDSIQRLQRSTDLTNKERNLATPLRPSPEIVLESAGQGEGRPQARLAGHVGYVAEDPPTDQPSAREPRHGFKKGGPEIPISQRDGAPEEGLKPERTGPLGSRTGPPKPIRERPPPSATACGPLERSSTEVYRKNRAGPAHGPEPDSTVECAPDDPSADGFRDLLEQTQAGFLRSAVLRYFRGA